MSTGGVLGNGKKLAYSLTSPVSWIEIPQLIDFELPQWVADKVDTTVSSSSKLKRSMPGMIDISDMPASFLYDPDEITTPEHDALLDLNLAGTTIWLRGEIPANRLLTRYKAFEFQAYVASWQASGALEARQELKVVFRFDGDSLTAYPAGASEIT